MCVAKKRWCHTIERYTQLISQKHWLFNLLFFCILICVIIIGTYRRLVAHHYYYNTSYFALPPYHAANISQEDNDLAQELLRLGALRQEDSKIIPNPELSAHSSAIVEKDSTLMALFFAGTKEGAEDVKIYQSFLYKDSLKWSEAKPILTRKQLTQLTGKFFKKIGNPIVFKDSNGNLHFFVVAVSLGGWATSKIYQFSLDSNFMPHFIRELHISPLGNLSFLVRAPALLLENGGFMLPLAHEMWDKYPLVAFFDSLGKLLFTKRINMLYQQLQPSIMPLTPETCVAFFRSENIAKDPPAFFQTCEMQGNVWNPPLQSNLFNYDSSSIMTAFNNNGEIEILLAHNDTGRKILSLFWLQDKKHGIFKKLITIDTPNNSTEVSYPSLVIDSKRLHIAYTYGRKNIKYTSITIPVLQALINHIKMQSK